MAFADPQSVTIDGTAISLPRVSSGVNAGAFKSNDGLTALSANHQYGTRRTRRVIRLDISKIAADPLLAGVNVKADMSVYLVVDLPVTGYNVADTKKITDGFVAKLSASSGAIMTSLLGGES